MLRFKHYITEKTSSLYVSRQLLNADELIAWAKEQGFKSILSASDMHVTIVYSKKEVSWLKLPKMSDDVKVSGGRRDIEKLGDATVLRFESKVLRRRWLEFCKAGASWDHDSYKPHVSITYDISKIDTTKIKPYDGALIFGPEKYAAVDDDWKAKVKDD